jgi:GTP-binding protein HflX
LRLIHTHLRGEGLTNEDYTDLAFLRLDLIAALTIDKKGFPGPVFVGHLVPENVRGEFWKVMEMRRVHDLDLDFMIFIRELEEDFARAQRSTSVEVKSDRAILISTPLLTNADPEDSMMELIELARSCEIEVVDTYIKKRTRRNVKFIIGKGVMHDLIIKALQLGANLLIFDGELSLSQLRSITDLTELRVIDRTQLILDIFARRAQTREGKIQVELAQLKYLLPRLITKNTAMSRLTGGIGARGPGETKLEINRRRTRDRINMLENQIGKLRRRRRQRRSRRKKRKIPIVSIVGYTNAGKSTLLNALTKSKIYTEDRVFATLDPTSRRVRFPRDMELIITDTVGFIRDLPRDLVKAFAATLDELHQADLLLHVIDASNPRFPEQIEAVENILEMLGLDQFEIFRILNKMDRVDPEMITEHSADYHAMPISALQPGSLRGLIRKIEDFFLDRALSSDGQDAGAGKNHRGQFSLMQ